MPELDLNLWLQAKDVAPEAVLVFTDAGQNTEIPQGEGKEPAQAFEIGVLLPNNDKRMWTMNVTSQRAVAQAYGTNTDNWVNKPVKVFVQEQNVRGTMKQVIYARVPDETLLSA